MMEDGTSQFIQVVVEDADAAMAELRGRGVTCEGVDEQAWGRFVYFSDPTATGGHSSSTSDVLRRCRLSGCAGWCRARR